LALNSNRIYYELGGPGFVHFREVFVAFNAPFRPALRGGRYGCRNYKKNKNEKSIPFIFHHFPPIIASLRMPGTFKSHGQGRNRKSFPVHGLECYVKGPI